MKVEILLVNHKYRIPLTKPITGCILKKYRQPENKGSNHMPSHTKKERNKKKKNPEFFGRMMDAFNPLKGRGDLVKLKKEAAARKKAAAKKPKKKSTKKK
jgi:hypothetical protein